MGEATDDELKVRANDFLNVLNRKAVWYESQAAMKRTYDEIELDLKKARSALLKAIVGEGKEGMLVIGGHVFVADVQACESNQIRHHEPRIVR